ncbi:hypothetical protein F5Y09DRAFT_310428 [Xylaria sp. FL1042]|nr:hypothetical protein F5Y09DRAFT_310428 [Xylaria sp. FL1042]
MRFSTAISASVALATFVSAYPQGLVSRAPKTAAQLIGEVSPNSKTACPKDNADCRTNEDAAGPFIKAMKDYELVSAGQIAAVLALTAFESGDYRYKHNVYPGRPGQGTSNMQMIDYNVQYANSFPELKDKVAAIGTLDSDDKKNQLLALVTDDAYNFGSGPWFLTTQCKDVVPQLAAGTDEAFTAYMQCIGVSATSDRMAYWTRAKTAFGL